MKQENQIIIVLVCLILVITLLSISIWNLKPQKEEIRDINNINDIKCTGILIDTNYISEYVIGQDMDLRFYSYLQLAKFSGTYNIFPLTVELQEPCSHPMKKVYNSYLEFPIGDDCYDENNCLWRFS